MEYRYKDSGIDWIGRIPSDWKTCRLKDCALVVLGKMLMSFPPKGQESAYTYERYLKSKNIGWLEIILDNGVDEMWFNKEEKNTYLLKDGDIVMNEGGDIGKVALWLQQPYDCYIQNSVHKITAGSTIYNHYLLYSLYHATTKGYFNSIVNQISIAHLTKEKLQNTPITLPPLSEQQRIAEYLDGKCREIDGLIALQEQMIGQLTDYKQSVITESVTKGLNPNAQLVSSGIDWIGDVPKGWNVVKLSLLTTKIGSGSTPTGGANVYVNEGVKFLRSQNVRFEGLDLSDVAHITDEIDEEMRGSRVLPGDVLLNITGGSIGRCYYADSSLGRANVNQHVSIIRPSKIETKFLKYYLQSFAGQHQVFLLQTGGNREGLSAAALSNFKILYPTKGEQHAIAEHLDAKCGEIEKLIETKRQKIETLKEYKKSVIYEAVTGKIDL